MPASRARRVLQTIGPGLIMAGAAIGVSHLVQSTRAGAEFGFAVAWIVVLACAAKYPFLQYGPRYAAATGESLLEGYARLGRWALILFAVITAGTMFATLASLTIVTAGLAARLFGFFPDPFLWSVAILTACVTLLMAGRYAALDTSMKLIMGVLAASTIATVVLAAGSAQPAPPDAPSTLSLAALPFLLALMGWMPVPIDVSVWHSLWTLERGAQTRQPSVREAVADFDLGYGLAFVMALCFLALGALLMHGSGEQFAAGAVPFANQLVGLYTRTLGPASGPVIALAVLTTMFSTTLAVTDAYPRTIDRLVGVWRGRMGKPAGFVYYLGLIVVPTGALVILFFFGGRMTLLIDVATTLAFLSAPVLAWINYRLITSEHMPEEHRPGIVLRAGSVAGLLFLIGFALAFLFIILL
jgi:Mn2+/Fe2+ NRAMP family transporter